MSEKPILFSSEMINAILDGRKTQTRRILKECKTHQQRLCRNNGSSHTSLQIPLSGKWIWHPTGALTKEVTTDIIQKYCPYGKVGDTLWVRETFYAFGKYYETGIATKTGKPEIKFQDQTSNSSGTRYRYFADETLPKPFDRFYLDWHKRPSIFMPRWASRITLEITNIRVERLQEISGKDAMAEGVPDCDEFGHDDCFYGLSLQGMKCSFQKLWDKINGKREGCSWTDNPYVWVIEFKKI